MTGLRLLLHAVRMVFSNKIAIVQIFALPAVLWVALFVFVNVYFGLSPSFWLSGQVGQVEVTGWGAAIFLIAAIIVVWLVTIGGVVNWHRFILLEENPKTLILHLSWRRILKYILAGLLIFVFLLVPLALFAFVGGAAAASFAKSGNVVMAHVIGILGTSDLPFWLCRFPCNRALI